VNSGTSEKEICHELRLGSESSGGGVKGSCGTRRSIRMLGFRWRQGKKEKAKRTKGKLRRKIRHFSGFVETGRKSGTSGARSQEKKDIEKTGKRQALAILSPAGAHRALDESTQPWKNSWKGRREGGGGERYGTDSLDNPLIYRARKEKDVVIEKFLHR